MDEASAAKLEELRLGAVSQGKEWLSRALYEMRKEELRALATAGGVHHGTELIWYVKLRSRFFSFELKEQMLRIGLCVTFLGSDVNEWTRCVSLKRCDVCR